MSRSGPVWAWRGVPRAEGRCLPPPADPFSRCSPSGVSVFACLRVTLLGGFGGDCAQQRRPRFWRARPPPADPFAVFPERRGGVCLLEGDVVGRFRRGLCPTTSPSSLAGPTAAGRPLFAVFAERSVGVCLLEGDVVGRFRRGLCPTTSPSFLAGPTREGPDRRPCTLTKNQRPPVARNPGIIPAQVLLPRARACAPGLSVVSAHCRKETHGTA